MHDVSKDWKNGKIDINIHHALSLELVLLKYALLSWLYFS